MKNYIILLITITFLSCKSSQLSPQNSLISISKNPCLKHCEVSDLHIFSDGTFIYNGVLNTKFKGNHKGKISSYKLTEISEALNKLSNKSPKIKGRDVSSVTIKYKSTNKTYKTSSKELITIKKITDEIINSIS